MKLRRLSLPLAVGAFLWRNPGMRRRLSGAAAGLRDRFAARTGGGHGPGGLDAVPVRRTATGDVETEDRAGTWADDGGGGPAGGQMPNVGSSADPSIDLRASDART
jgi:hypothetical protein